MPLRKERLLPLGGATPEGAWKAEEGSVPGAVSLGPGKPGGRESGQQSRRLGLEHPLQL